MCEGVCVRLCEKVSARLWLFVYVCVCVQVSARVCVYVCVNLSVHVYVCVWVRADRCPNELTKTMTDEEFQIVKMWVNGTLTEDTSRQRETMNGTISFSSQRWRHE